MPPPPSLSNPLPTRTYFSHNRPSKILSHLLSDPTLSDLTVFASQKPFPCHRAILSASSSIFHAMFTSPMKEPTTGQLHLPDVPATVFAAARQYMYGSPFTVHPDLMLHFSIFVRQYDIGAGELADFVDSLLISALTLDNVLSIRAHAELYATYRLQRACDRYITTRMAQLAASRAFLDSDAQQAESALRAPMRVSSELVGRRCAQHVLTAALAWLKVDDRRVYTDTVLGAVDVEGLSLPALVRASRDEVAMADERFRMRLLRAFAKRAEGDLGFEPCTSFRLLDYPSRQ